MYKQVDFSDVISAAWHQYNPLKKIESVVDISAMVSTNHVFRVKFDDGSFIIAKCSYFGKFEHFKEDHTIINVLANTLPAPYENFLARSLVNSNGDVFTYRYKEGLLDAWIVFYNPITIDRKLPRKLSEAQIRSLGRELGHLHKVCYEVSPNLPPSSKTLKTDIGQLLEILDSDIGMYQHRGHVHQIQKQCDLFFENAEKLGYRHMKSIPLFVDWNIGNFSVTKERQFYSRWDYDWFRVSVRPMDFYFFSRVCSSVGDKTVFSYFIDPLMEDRFLWFLEEYHAIFPLDENEIYFIRESYRFFILNYVIKDGNYFFHQIYSTRLQQEAHALYFPQLDHKFNAEKILKALKI